DLAVPWPFERAVLSLERAAPFSSEREPFSRASSDPGAPTRRRREGGSVKILVGRRLSERPARALHQVALDEHVDVAVEDPVHIGDLLLRTMILDELVRVQHVAADLAAEADFFFHAADLREPRLVLLDLDV